VKAWLAAAALYAALAHPPQFAAKRLVTPPVLREAFTVLREPFTLTVDPRSMLWREPPQVRPPIEMMMQRGVPDTSLRATPQNRGVLRPR
jgi:hypothetical protein